MSRVTRARRGARPGPRPFFKAMTDRALWETYWSTRELLANAFALRMDSVRWLEADLDLIVALGRQRGIRFLEACPAEPEV